MVRTTPSCHQVLPVVTRVNVIATDDARAVGVADFPGVHSATGLATVLLEDLRDAPLVDSLVRRTRSERMATIEPAALVVVLCGLPQTVHHDGVVVFSGD